MARTSVSCPASHCRSTLRATGALEDAVRADALLLVVPAQVLADFARTLAPLVAPGTPLVICAKGIEKGTGRLVNEVLTGPCPARRSRSSPDHPSPRDVAKGLPTAVTIAAAGDLAARLQASLNSPTFRPYASDDITGVALGGAAKNVYAIACGVVEGMGLGENARAALLGTQLRRTGAAGRSVWGQNAKP